MIILLDGEGIIPHGVIIFCRFNNQEIFILTLAKQSSVTLQKLLLE